MTGSASLTAATAVEPHWPGEGLREWYAQRQRASRSEVERIPFDALRGWQIDPATGNVYHTGGGFFTVEGLDVHLGDGPVQHWQQPIISQPEIGILGLLVRRVAGRLQCLMQAKMEPGNVNGVQLSPTVQATRSNYTQVHGGSRVRYLDAFTESRPEQVIADVLQSEQGSWFLGKRNRNIVVEVTDRMVENDNFHWIDLADLKRLFRIDNLVNMDTRTVLACLVSAPMRSQTEGGTAVDDFESALDRSFAADSGSKHTDLEVLSWFTGLRTRQELNIRRIPLGSVQHWRRDRYEIHHARHRHFSIIGVEVHTGVREVSGWTQPMLLPRGRGVVAFLTRRFDDVLHVLVQAVAQPGLRDLVEMGATVQCRPENYSHLPVDQQPPFLSTVLSAPPERIRYDCVLSEEGGRFYHAENRYMVVDAGDLAPAEPPADFLWVTPRQLSHLLRHSHYVNVEARSLLACLYSMSRLSP